MANIATNTLVIKHNDKDQIAKFVDTYKNGSLAKVFCGVTVDKRTNNEFGQLYLERLGAAEPVISEDGTTCYISQFGTFYDGPYELYEALEDHGFNIEASMSEGGSDVVELYVSGFGKEELHYDSVDYCQVLIHHFDQQYYEEFYS